LNYKKYPSLKITLLVYSVDVRDTAAVDKMAKDLADAGKGPIDILINNAGWVIDVLIKYRPAVACPPDNFSDFRHTPVHVCACVCM
jgi:NAD(P)-dependent dehydrogenase (short-subunit alcohol dehydrogenase family)